MININYNSLEQYTFYELKKYCKYYLFINKGINDSYKTLGSYYVLSALTLLIMIQHKQYHGFMNQLFIKIYLNI